MKRALVISVTLAAVGLVASLVYWNRVPDPMPIHWGVHGQPDNWGPRAVGLLLGPGLCLLLPLLLPAVMRLDPRRDHVERSAEVAATLMITFAVLFLAIHALTLRAALSDSQQLPGNAVVLLIGGLLIVIGNLMPKLRSNWFMGIRTPWTLQSEKVWHRTHRVGGWTMVTGGVIAILAALFTHDNALFGLSLTAILAGSLFPIPYSYFAWRQESSGE